jgi:hypothetical protein
MLALEFLVFFAVLLLLLPVAWVAPLVVIATTHKAKTARRSVFAALSPIEAKQQALANPFLEKHGHKPIVRRLREALEAEKYADILRSWRDLRLELIAAGDNLPGQVEFTTNARDEELRDLVAALRSSQTAVRG